MIRIIRIVQRWVSNPAAWIVAVDWPATYIGIQASPVISILDIVPTHEPPQLRMIHPVAVVHQAGLLVEAAGGVGVLPGLVALAVGVRGEIGVADFEGAVRRVGVALDDGAVGFCQLIAISIAHDESDYADPLTVRQTAGAELERNSWPIRRLPLGGP